MRTLKNILTVLVAIALFTGCNGGGGGGTDAPSGQSNNQPGPSGPSTDLIKAISFGVATPNNNGTMSLKVALTHLDNFVSSNRWDLVWLDVDEADRDNYSVDAEGTVHALFGGQQFSIEASGLGDLHGVLLMDNKNGHTVVHGSGNFIAPASPASGIWVGTQGFAAPGETVAVVLQDRSDGSNPTIVGTSSNSSVVGLINEGGRTVSYVAKKAGTSVLTFDGTTFTVRVHDWEPYSMYYLSGGQSYEFIDKEYIRGFSSGVIACNTQFSTATGQAGLWTAIGNGPFPIDVPDEEIYDFDSSFTKGSRVWNLKRVPEPLSQPTLVLQYVGYWSKSDFVSKSTWGFNDGDQTSSTKHDHQGGAPDNYLLKAITHPTKSGRIAWSTGPDLAASTSIQ